MYANSVSDSERTGTSVVHRRFRNLGKSVEDDGDMASRLSPQGIPRPMSASSPRNQSTPIARSHSSGSCSPADTSTRTKNLTPFSHRRRHLGENRSPAANEEQVVNEHHQHQSHHMSFSSDRLSAASADEEVFLARVRQSVSPPQKLQEESSQSGIGPLRVRIRSKESISSGAHGCDHRTNSDSPLSHREKVHSDSDRGPRDSSLTGSVRLTMKEKSEDLTDESGPQKIRTLSTRTNSSTDEFPGIIRAHSKAISYESICLKIKEESTEIPKTIQVISMSQPSNLISTTKAVLLEQEETNCSPPGSIHGTPCSAGQLYNVQSVEAISVRPVQRDHSIKHRSTVFFSSEQSPSGSHNNLLSQIKSANVLPVQTLKVSSFPAKISQQDVLESMRKSEHAQPSSISEQQNQSRSGEVVTQNEECRDDTLRTSTQKSAKSNAPPQKLTIIGATELGAKPDKKRSSKVGPTVQASNEVPNRSVVKESKFFLKRDQQLPMNSSQLIMGTVFTDRHKPRQNLLFPGTDFIQRDNSGRTSESKTSQGSKSVQQVSSYKIIKYNSRPVVEENQISVVVPESKGDPLVNKTKLSADGSAQTAALFSKDSGSRIKIIKPAATAQDNKTFASSFLCSLSKFSQPPAESVFISTSRPKPLSVSSSTSSFSRVDWAKQRLGKAPENKPSTTAISQLKTSLKDLSSSGTTHQPGSDHQQMHNTTSVASTATLEQDRTNCIGGKHTITVARQQFPSVGESSQTTTAPLPLPVTVQDVTVSPSPVVLGPAKSTTSSALLAFKKPSEASMPPSERQNSASTGNFATGSLKVFIQSANPTAVLKRTSLLVPYLNAPLSDATSLQSTDTANCKDTRTPELEVQCYGDMESTGSFRKPYTDSTCLVTTVLPSSLSQDVTVTAFVCDPPVSDVCVLVQETGATMIVEPVLPEDNQVVVVPIDSIACKEQPLVDSSNSNVITKVAHAGASPKNSFQVSSTNSAVGEAIDFGQVAQDPLRVICPCDEAFGGKTLELEISPSDFLDNRFESDSLRKEDSKSADNRSKGEISPNENNQQQLLSDSLSSDTYAQVPGPGVCLKEAQTDVAGDIYVVDSGWNLSQSDGNPESPCPSSASEESNGSMVIIDEPETTLESTTKICRLQGPNNSQREFIRDLVQPEIEISAGRNLATTKDNRRSSDGLNESLTASTRDTAFESVPSVGKRAERTDKNVKPEAEVVRGPLTKMPGIPSLEIIVGKSEATSSSATTSTSSAKPTSSTKIATAEIASAKKSQNNDTVSKEGPLSHADKGDNLVQNFAVDILQKDFVQECRVGSGQSILPDTKTTNPSLVGLTKTTAEKEKTRRVVRFESQDELLMYSPREFSASRPGFSPPSDVPTEIPCLPINETEADALGASATISGPAVIRSPDAPFLEDFPSKSSRKDPETSREDSSKASPPSTGKTMAKPCIVRKQLIHLDSALHPSSCVPPEAKPVEARWSPKLVRKLNLAEAKDVDVSDLDVAPDLMDFLSKQMEKASGDVKQPASNREAKDELEIGIREIPSLSVQRKPPLSLPLKSADREEDALPSATSATDNDAVKPEAEVGKRKFFSALKANASSFRAKKVPADDPSPDKSHLDRLASFALISDVGIGAKRRQFQRHKETSLTDPTTDAHSKLLTLESPPSTDRNQTKEASFLVLSSPDADDDKTKTRLGRDDESETRLGAESEKKTRLSRPEIDSDDDFDRLVEINFRQLVDEKGSAAGALRDGLGSTELMRKGAKNQTGTGLGGTSGTAGVEGSRRQMSRFKTQPVTPVEVEKAREMALYQTNSGN